MVQAVSFEDEAKALSLMAEGDKATRQPHDDYAGDLKKHPTGSTK